MGKRRHLFQLIRNRDGATIIEFALVAPLFFLLIFGIIEFGLVMFSSIAIESAVMQASRDASIGRQAPGGDRVQYIRQSITDKTRGLIRSDGVVISAIQVSAGELPEADICMSDPPKVGGPCCDGCSYEDVNNNGEYDANPGNLSLGGTGDIIELRVMYPWKVQIPLMGKFFGENGVMMISSSTVVKNEPF